ncbi:hypothetical protein EKH80_20590 [Dyella choica]|uniref:Uncharacterized protein n=1 Tax=Dyella choica TaxID=1927959 RepID=A0A432M0P8_9GAMM|nr:hypothetical protein EKH80_20590 [Dyella choica]
MAADDVGPVNISATYSWNLLLYEYQGMCYIAYTTTAPFRAQQGQLMLYSGSPPANPQDCIAWTWDSNPSPFNTGKPWGSGYSAGWIAQQSPNGPYTYVAATGVTSD